MDEECDFDALAALLDDDDRDEKSNQHDDAAESSDDDIDEDELDRLAALVEEEESVSQVLPPKSDSSSYEPRSDNNLQTAEKDPNEAEEDDGEKDADKPTRSDSVDEDDVGSSLAQAQTEESEGEQVDSEDDSSIREQLLFMQKQMALLAAKLDKKKTNKKDGSRSKSSGSESNEDASTSKVKPSKESMSSTKKNELRKTPSDKKLKSSHSSEPSSKRLKECNLFDIIDQEQTSGKGSAVSKPKPKVDNSAASQPWERKKSVPSSGYKLSSSTKTTVSRPSKELEERLSSTVDKIVSKQQKSEAVIKEKPKSNFYGKKDTKEGDDMEKNLFGSDSDSDWGDMDGDKQSDLTDQGRDFYKSLKKKRVAHEASFDNADLETFRDKPKQSKNWKSPIYGNATHNGLAAASASSAAAAKAAQDKDVTVDPFSGIRIIKPIVSSLDMKRRMEGRRLIKLSHIHAKRNTAAVEGDWVTIGVVAHKGEPRMSQNNKQYSVWKLTDLDDCDQVINFFLFGDVHKAHWKTIQGSVIGLLNPSIMKSAEKYAGKDQESASIMLKDKLQMMLMGTSKDLGVCRGKTKSGKQCTNFINKNRTEYCTYHVQAQFKRASSKRGELSSVFSGVTPTNHQKKLFSNKNSTVIYGGKTYTSNSMPQAAASVSRKKKDAFTVKQLQSHAVLSGGSATSKVSTLSLHKLLPEDKEKLQEYKQMVGEKEKARVQKHEQFHGLLSTPTVGAMNFVKHLVKKDQIQVEEKKKGPVVPIKASDLLKMVKSEHTDRQASRGKSVAAEAAPSPKLGGGGGPTLGRGLAPGIDIEFDFDKPIQMSRPSKDHMKNELRKKKAIAKVITGGGISKKDPNAVKKKIDSDVREKVQKRVAQEAFEENDEKNDEPAKKKSRYLGNIDMNDPRIQELLNKKSQHAAALTNEEQEKLEAYFEVLEKKEAMEDQMSKVTKMKVKAVICKQCKYKAQSANARCKEERHELTWVDAVKRWFACAQCKTKCWALDRYPSDPCKSCGSTKYEKSSMLYEKKGPKLPSEELLLRGEERKHVNS